ncbi:hypothetical protein ACJX0J_019872, partial [Zea mays]
KPRDDVCMAMYLHSQMGESFGTILAGKKKKREKQAHHFIMDKIKTEDWKTELLKSCDMFKGIKYIGMLKKSSPNVCMVDKKNLNRYDYEDKAKSEKTAFETGNHKLFSKGLDDIVEEREQEVIQVTTSAAKGCFIMIAETAKEKWAKWGWKSNAETINTKKMSKRWGLMLLWTFVGLTMASLPNFLKITGVKKKYGVLMIKSLLSEKLILRMEITTCLIEK